MMAGVLTMVAVFVAILVVAAVVGLWLLPLLHTAMTFTR